MSDSGSRTQPRFRDRLETLCVEMIDRGILFPEAQEQFEKCFILEVMRRTGGNVLKASERLRIHRNTLAKRLAHYKEKRR